MKSDLGGWLPHVKSSVEYIRAIVDYVQFVTRYSPFKHLAKLASEVENLENQSSRLRALTRVYCQTEFVVRASFHKELDKGGFRLNCALGKALWQQTCSVSLEPHD